MKFNLYLCFQRGKKCFSTITFLLLLAAFLLPSQGFSQTVNDIDSNPALQRQLKADPSQDLPSERARKLRQQQIDEYNALKGDPTAAVDDKLRQWAEEVGLSASVADERCVTEEYNDYLRNRYNLSEPQEFEEWMEQKLVELGGYQPGRVVPVVVHVLHNGEPEGVGPNISEAQVLSQLKVLNDDFNRVAGTRGAGTDSYGGYSDRAASMDLRFCLATVDPFGNPTDGINRIDGGQNSYDYLEFESGLKQSTIWNPDYYFNIWIGELTLFGGSGLLGYAQFPSQSGLGGLDDDEGPADTDGIVVHVQAFGSADDDVNNDFYLANWPFIYGRTATHEAGHFFGFRHIWGDGDCSVDDFVDDTPNASGSSRSFDCGGPSPRITCGNVNMVENYMDYSDDDCYNLFTFGQKQRLDVVMAFSPRRASLLNSQVCNGIPPAMPFAMASQNAGANPGPAGLAVPDNDLCEAAETLNCGDVVTGNTEEATNIGIPGVSCDFNTPTYGVWYSFTGTGKMTTLSTDNAGSDYDTRLIVYSGSCGPDNLVCVAGDDDGGAGLLSELEFPAETGVTYYIYVCGFGDNTGDFELSLICGDDILPPPDNDEAAGALAIDCGQSVDGNNVGATQSAESTYSSNKDVWYVFNSAGDQKLTVSTCNDADFDTRIEIFDAALNPLARNDDGAGCGLTSSLSTLVGAGAYYITVGGFSGQEGNFTLTASCEDVNILPGGLTCDDAVALECGTTILGSTLDAIDPIQSGAGGLGLGLDDETLEPQAPGKWYTITVDELSVIQLNACNEGTDYDLDIEVYVGGPCAVGGPNLTLWASNDSGSCSEGSFFASNLAFLAYAGVEYKIFVNGWYIANSQGNYEIDVECSTTACEVYDIATENAGDYGYITTLCSPDLPAGPVGPPGYITSVFVIDASYGAIYLTNPLGWSLKINGIETPFEIVDAPDISTLIIAAVNYLAGPGVDVEFSFGQEGCSIAKEDLFDAPEGCSTFLGDYVWEDANGNGVQDDGDSGVGGVTVDLYNYGTLVASTTTAADGSYTHYPPPGPNYVVFRNVPGSYYTLKDATTDDLDSDAAYSPFSGDGTTDVFNVVNPFYSLDTDAGLSECPPLSSACNDNVYITLDGECEALITPDMVLEGDYICYKDVIVDVVAPGNIHLGNVVPSGYFGQQLIYEVSDPQSDYTCWGYITLQDKTAPVITCPESTDRAAVYIQANALVDNLSSSDPTFTPGNYSCWTGPNSISGPGNAPHYYNEIKFSVAEDGIYTFYMYSPEFDATGAIFQDGFDPNGPCENIIGLGESTFTSVSGVDEFLYGVPGWQSMANSDPTLRMALPLRADAIYSIITTSRAPLEEGVFGWFVFRDGGLDSDGNILIDPGANLDKTNDDEPYTVYDGYVYYDLLCSDLEHVLITGNEQCYYTDGDGNLLAGIDWDGDGEVDYNDEGLVDKLLPTGMPYAGGLNNGGSASDNCDYLKICVSDELVPADGDCDSPYIIRTFQAVDKSGNESNICTQNIYFRNPTYADVIFPQVTVPIECDEDFPLDDNGEPHPSLTGYPFVRAAFGHHDLDESYCTMGAEYRTISNIDVCEGTYKITREWTVLDWCHTAGQDPLNNSPLVNWRQIIKVGDFTPPEVEVDNPEAIVQTGGFSCGGNLLISGLTVTDNCSSSWTAEVTVYEITEVPVYDKYGQDTGETTTEANVFAEGLSVGDIVTNVILGNTYKVHYAVSDACGNTTTAYYDLTIVDKVEPVAVCDDDLHISIGGEGIGRVTAEDVDEGSWDNCELLDLHVSRKLVDEATRDAYLDEVYSLTFGDLVKASNLYGRLYDMDKSSDADIWVVDEDGDGEWDEDEDHRVLRYKDEMWFTWWRDDIWFLCIDMGLDVTIELLARDVYHNTNVCWLDVLIEDKVAPYCEAPEDVTIDCTDLPYGFDPEDDDQLAALFGEAIGFDNCNATARQVFKEVKYWECNSGRIERFFQAFDDKGLTTTRGCKQVIIVNRVHDYEIKFPKDASSDCTTPIADTIETNEIACDLLSVNVYDERFEASGDACYKIKRTYKVINWCEYDGESEPIVVDRDHDCNGITGDEDIWVLVRPDSKGSKGDDDSHPDVYYDRNGDETDEDPEEYERGCSPENPDGYWEKDTQFGNYHYDIHGNEATSVGYWQYSQFIKVYDNTAPTIVGGPIDDVCSIAADCAADVSVDITVDDFCAGDDVVVKVFLLPDEDTGLPASVDLQIADNAALVDFEITGTHPTYTLSGRFPFGDHAFEVHAVDGCQNSELLEIPFSVIDCKAPSPICINGLAVELMPTEDGGGMMDIWASDFQVSGLEDCSGIEGLYITRDADGDDAEKKAELILTCDDPDTLAVRIWAVDNEGNADYCLTYVLVQDNLFDLCDPAGPAAVSGLITDESNQTVENVEVSLTGGAANSITTNVDGSYAFTGLEAGADYTVTPILDEDYLNGVSTFDLVLITKHILGTKKLDSPYKLIAADANRSNSVTALDLIQLRKLVLSVNRELAANTSWRFVPASYSFPDPTNPWAQYFPEILNYNDLETAVLTGDFIAIKIGDVNGNATPNSTVAENRSLVGQFNLNVEDQSLLAGNEYRLSFTAPVANVQGYQFTLNYEGLELMDIEYGVAQAEHFGVIEDGVLTTSWNGEATTNELFTLVVRANVDAQLSDLLSVSSRYTQAEAYNTADELMGVALAFNGSVVSEGYELYQNQPNPFAETTMIGFSLPAAAKATIRINDVTGKTLKLIRGEFAKGYNQINLE